jgi:hypothetical protein
MITLLEFFALAEGEHDASFRREARQAIDKIVAGAKKNAGKPELGGAAEIEERSGFKVIVVDARKLGLDQDLEIIVNSPKEKLPMHGTFVPRDGQHGDRIELFITDPRDEEEMLGTIGRWFPVFISQRAARSVFIHEYIHLLDYHRIGPAVMKRLNLIGIGDEGYHNSPLELNAYIQQGLARVEDELKRAGSKEAALAVMGKTPQEFHKRVLKHMNKSFLKNLTDDNKKKLAKRVYQMYKDVSAATKEDETDARADD